MCRKGSPSHQRTRGVVWSSPPPPPWIGGGAFLTWMRTASRPRILGPPEIWCARSAWIIAITTWNFRSFRALKVVLLLRESSLEAADWARYAARPIFRSESPVVVGISRPLRWRLIFRHCHAKGNRIPPVTFRGCGMGGLTSSFLSASSSGAERSNSVVGPTFSASPLQWFFPRKRLILANAFARLPFGGGIL